MKEKLLGSGIGQVPITDPASADPRRPDAPNLEGGFDMGYKLLQNCAKIGRELSPSSKCILRCLCEFTNDNDGKNECYPSIARIEERTNFSERTIRSAIKDLQERGYLKIVKREGRPSYYYIDLEPRQFSHPCEDCTPATVAPHPGNSRTTTPAILAPPLQITNTSINEQPSIVKTKPSKPAKEQFVPPTLEEVEQCMKARHFLHPHQEAEKFIAFYEEQDWCRRSGKVMVKLKDWRRAVIQWEKPWLVNTAPKPIQEKPKPQLPEGDWLTEEKPT